MFYLAIRNIQRKKWESILSITLILLTVAVFVIGLFTMNMMDKGLNTSSKRLGADILVLPHVAQADAQQALFTAAPINIYMDKDISEQVADISEVSEASPQFFTQTLDESCCSVVGAKRLVGYDPETDFILEPWLSENDGNALNKDEVIVGSSLPDFLGGKVTILGELFSVVNLLGETGSGMDETLFVNIDVARDLAKNSPYLQHLWEDQAPENLISAVMVKTSENVDPTDVAKEINESITGVNAVVAGNVIQGVRSELVIFQKVFLFIFIMLFFISSLSLFGRFVSIAEKRILDIGLIRSLGGTKGDSLKSILYEIGVLVLSGGLIGSVLGLVGGFYVYNWLVEMLNLPTISLSLSSIFLFGCLGIGISILLGIFSASLPVFRSLRKDPVEILTRKEI